jgi:hypothetical protein
MNRDPDWEVLNQLNFMLAPRISAPLNEALNALTLAEMPESELDPQLWRDKAKIVVGNLLHLYQAWSASIQFKNGLKLPPNAIRPFPVQSLLDWLTIQLGLIPPARAKRNFYLNGNQPSIQEALLLLYTVSVTQGTEVHLVVDPTASGSWFRIRFARNKTMPTSIDDMLASFRSDWRSQDSAFELRLARDFVELNGSQINIHWSEKQGLGEFAFFIRQDRGHKPETSDLISTPDTEHARIVSNITRSLLAPEEKTQVGTRTEVKVMPPMVRASLSNTTIPFGDIVAQATTESDEGDDISTRAGEGQDTKPETIIGDPDATRPIKIEEELPKRVLPTEGEDTAVAERVESEDSKPGTPAGIIATDDTPLVVPIPSSKTEANTTKSDDSDASKETKPRIISVAMPEPETPPSLMPKKDSPADSDQEEMSS